MKRPFGLIGRAAAAVVVTSVAVTPIAFAGVPVFDRNVVIDDTTFLPRTSAICGFDVFLHQVGTITFKTSTSPEGAVTNREVSRQGEATYIAPATGKSLTVHPNGPGTHTETTYPDGRYVIFTAGLDEAITLPGEGHVFIGAGWERITIYPNDDVTVETNGNFDSDRSGICDLLR